MSPEGNLDWPQWRNKLKDHIVQSLIHLFKTIYVHMIQIIRYVEQDNEAQKML